MWEAILEKGFPRAERLSPENIWEYRRFVFRIAKSIVLDRDVAEDMTQSTLLKALKSGEAVRDTKAFLRQIVVRECLNHLRRPRVDTLGEEITTREPSADRRLQVEASLAQLDPEQRSILALVCGEGLSYREVADLLGIPEGTVASRLNRAKAAFRAAFGEEDE